MMLRLLVLFLTVSLAGFFGQTGMFGPVSSRLKAGDFAADIVFTRVLNAPGPDPWSSTNLSGKVTVLTFFPDTSHNLQSVTRWNAVVDQFASKPVQFVWITAEKDSSLDPWLKDHPVKGWVLHDPNGETGRAYGMEFPEVVIIGSDRRILGFDSGFGPSERTLNAALEGRITTDRPKMAGMAELQAFAESGRVLLNAESRRMPGPDDHKPDFPPSYALYVSPAKGEGGNFSAGDFQSFEDYDLRGVLAALYDVNPVRIQLPASLDDGKHYDFAIVLPKPESRESMYNRMRQGIQDHFHVTIKREARLVDAYVVTAPNAKFPAMKPREEDQGLGFSDSYSVEFQVVHPHGELAEPPEAVGIGDIRGISVEGTVDKFCHALEGNLDRPVVNETNVEGEFRFDVKVDRDRPDDFLERLHSQLGIVITPAQRSVEIVRIEPRGL